MNGPLRTAHGIRLTTQVKHRDEDLLTRKDRHIGVLVAVGYRLCHPARTAGCDTAAARPSISSKAAA